MGRIGYFPSKYVLKLAAGEKVLQVTHNIQIADTERGDNIALLRDQIVIQVGVGLTDKLNYYIYIWMFLISFLNNSNTFSFVLFKET